MLKGWNSISEKYKKVIINDKFKWNDFFANELRTKPFVEHLDLAAHSSERCYNDKAWKAFNRGMGWALNPFANTFRQNGLFVSTTTMMWFLIVRELSSINIRLSCSETTHCGRVKSPWISHLFKERNIWIHRDAFHQITIVSPRVTS